MFVGDNVDKRKGVRSMRADHQSELQNTYSMLVVCSWVLSPPLDATSFEGGFGSLQLSAFLPTVKDIKANHVLWEIKFFVTPGHSISN